MTRNAVELGLVYFGTRLDLPRDSCVTLAAGDLHRNKMYDSECSTACLPSKSADQPSWHTTAKILSLNATITIHPHRSVDHGVKD